MFLFVLHQDVRSFVCRGIDADLKVKKNKTKQDARASRKEEAKQRRRDRRKKKQQAGGNIMRQSVLTMTRIFFFFFLFHIELMASMLVCFVCVCGVPLEKKSGCPEEETTTTALSLSLSQLCVRVVFLALSQVADVRFQPNC